MIVACAPSYRSMRHRLRGRTSKKKKDFHDLHVTPLPAAGHYFQIMTLVYYHCSELISIIGWRIDRENERSLTQLCLSATFAAIGISCCCSCSVVRFCFFLMVRHVHIRIPCPPPALPFLYSYVTPLLTGLGAHIQMMFSYLSLRSMAFFSRWNNWAPAFSFFSGCVSGSLLYPTLL